MLLREAILKTELMVIAKLILDTQVDGQVQQMTLLDMMDYKLLKHITLK